MAGARNNSQLRVTLLSLALLGLLLLSHSAAPVEAAGYPGAGKKSFSMNGAGGRTLSSFSMNGAGGRTLSSFSMNSADSESKGGSRGGSGAGDA